MLDKKRPTVKGMAAPIAEYVLKTHPGPAAAVDPGGRIRKVNRAFAELLRYQEEELMGIQFEDLCDRDGLDRCRLLTGPLAAALKDGGHIRDMALTLVGRDGLKVDVLFSASGAAPDSRGERSIVATARRRSGRDTEVAELIAANKALKERVKYLEDFRDGVLGMIRDIDRSEQELEAAYGKLKHTQAQLIQSSKMTALGELSAGLAHEISQPLTVIKGLAQGLMRQGEDRGHAFEKLKLMFDASEKMEQIMRHLRVFSRSDEPVMGPVNLNAAVKDACMIVRETLLKNSIEMIQNLCEVPLVLGSCTRLEQVVINLITNARDAMKNGGVIAISTGEAIEDGKKYALLTISDTGCGIHEADIPNIFDPFFTTKGPGKGTGLGLSISYGIIKEHHGDITVKSSKGAGTTFRIRLPALEAQRADPSEVESSAVIC
jgi:PAS domain S-box-containing protein